LRSFFSRHLPEYSIIGEECGAQNSNNGKIITLDPLDGTKSFKARLPCFGPAIGVYHYGTNVAGIEYNVLRDTMYVATEETGLERIGNSYGDERRMVIFIGGDIKQSARFPEFLHKVQMCLAEYRVLAYEQDVLTKTLVCDGKLAGFFHAGLARHDIGATPLFCRFSGTCLTDLHGHNYDFLDETSVVEMYNTGKKKIIYSCPIVIAKPGLHGRFLSALQDNYSCFE
jgi:histidinol-phosphatase